MTTVSIKSDDLHFWRWWVSTYLIYRTAVSRLDAAMRDAAMDSYVRRLQSLPPGYQPPHLVAEGR